MSVKRPQISAVRQSNGTEFLITMLNFEAGDTWNIYRANDKFGELIEEVRDHDQAAYTITGLDPDQNIMARVSYNNAPLSASIEITEDYEDSESYVVVAPLGDTVISDTTETFQAPWMDNDLTNVMVATLENEIIEWIPSQPVISIGENQTL